MINFIDGLLIGILVTILVYKIFIEHKVRSNIKSLKERERELGEIVEKMLKDENDLKIFGIESKEENNNV